MHVSYSSITTYADCPQKYFYSYVMRIEPKKKPRPLQFGSDFHKLLELRWNKKALQLEYTRIQDAFNDLTEQQAVDLGDSYVTDLLTVFHDYRLIYADDKKPKELEHAFEIKIGSFRGEPVYFTGIIDEIFDDDITIGEHKTFGSSKPDNFFLTVNTQVALYARALALQGRPQPRRIRWDYVRSYPADEPLWLDKSQRFSEAASKRVTPFSWLRACKHRDITDPAILNKGSLYNDNVGEFFFRRNLEIIPKAVDKHWEDFKDLAREVVTKGSNNRRQRQNMGCAWCAYKQLCYGYHTDADVDFMINRDFQVKEARIHGDETPD